jgi:uncharacterized membrane protein
MKYLKEIMLLAILFEVIFVGFMMQSSLSSEGVCVLNDSQTCDQVQFSKYGEIFGISITNLGFFAFFALLFAGVYTFYFDKKFYPSFNLMITLGCFFAIYFIILQVIILKKICSNCFIVDFMMIFIFILNRFYRRN